MAKVKCQDRLCKYNSNGICDNLLSYEGVEIELKTCEIICKK
jgi:hypothetical protein